MVTLLRMRRFWSPLSPMKLICLYLTSFYFSWLQISQDRVSRMIYPPVGQPQRIFMVIRPLSFPWRRCSDSLDMAWPPTQHEDRAISTQVAAPNLSWEALFLKNSPLVLVCSPPEKRRTKHHFDLDSRTKGYRVRQVEMEVIGLQVSEIWTPC